MLKSLTDIELELGTNEFMTVWNIEENRKIIKSAINFGATLLADIRIEEHSEMMDEMYHSYLNDKEVLKHEGEN